MFAPGPDLAGVQELPQEVTKVVIKEKVGASRWWVPPSPEEVQGVTQEGGQWCEDLKACACCCVIAPVIFQTREKTTSDPIHYQRAWTLIEKLHNIDKVSLNTLVLPFHQQVLTCHKLFILAQQCFDIAIVESRKRSCFQRNFTRVAISYWEDIFKLYLCLSLDHNRGRNKKSIWERKRPYSALYVVRKPCRYWPIRGEQWQAINQWEARWWLQSNVMSAVQDHWVTKHFAERYQRHLIHIKKTIKTPWKLTRWRVSLRWL